MSEYSNDKELDELMSAFGEEVDKELNITSPKIIDVETDDDIEFVENESSDDRLLGEAIAAIKTNIDLNNEILKIAAENAQATGGADHVESYASVTMANVDLIKCLTDIMSKNKDREQRERLKIMELETKKELAKSKSSGHNDQIPNGSTFQQNNFVLTSTPAELCKILSISDPAEKLKLLEEITTSRK